MSLTIESPGYEPIDYAGAINGKNDGRLDEGVRPHQRVGDAHATVAALLDSR